MATNGHLTVGDLDAAANSAVDFALGQHQVRLVSEVANVLKGECINYITFQMNSMDHRLRLIEAQLKTVPHARLKRLYDLRRHLEEQIKELEETQ